MSQTVKLSEKEMLHDLLNSEKSMVSLYATAITESTCPDLRQVLIQHMQQTCQDQYMLFDQMRSKGYYEIKDAQAGDTQQAKVKFTNMRNGLQ